MANVNSITYCGIDFGTTNSTLAIVKDDQPLALSIDPNNSSPEVFKSLVYISPNNQPTTGFSAITKYLDDLENIPSKPPRLINTGRMIKTFGPSGHGGAGPPIWVPEIIEVDDSGRGRLLQSLKSALTNSSFTGTEIFNQIYTLEDLLAILLGDIKTRAEKIIHHSLDSVVIGRPVKYVGTGFENTALQRMHQIATKCGFKHIKFEYEPAGAALNFGLNLSQPQIVLVFDFGGGTLDICIMKLPQKQILSVSGRPIGGDLINSQIINRKLLKYFGANVTLSGKIPFPHYLLSALTNWYHLSLLKTIRNIEMLDTFILQANTPKPVNNFKQLIVNDYGYKLFQEIDRAKIELTTQPTTTIKFSSPHLNFSETLTLDEFNSIIANDLLETKVCLTEALNQAQLSPADIDYVLLTGGSSYIPAFINLLHTMFDTSKILDSNRFTSVALGLALRAKEIFD